MLSPTSQKVIEKAAHGQNPAVYKCPADADDSPLRRFIALQKSALLILGPRRVPPLPCPASSTSTAISIVTSLGFGMLEHEDYVEAVQKLRPDIIVGMGDVPFGHRPGVKRADKMGDRTLAWVEALVNGIESADTALTNTALFAPLLPIDRDVQSWYLNALRDELSEKVSGLVVYETRSVEAVPNNLVHLPRLYLGGFEGPHRLLDAISVGIDIFTLPFVNEATDAGIALNFVFSSPNFSDHNTMMNEQNRQPLGIDLWSVSFSADLSPLRESCDCYTCTNHHRAYVQHLLNAKEMLGWVLLQLHNHHTMDLFFEGVRQSIQSGKFEQQRVTFQRLYQRELPAKTGQGPRVRGYTIKSEGRGEPKKNPTPWSREMNDVKEKLAESVLPDPDDDAGDLEQKGVAEKP